MNIFYKYGIVAVALMSAMSASAITLEQAKAMYLSGDYAAALPVFRSQLKERPRDGALNQWVGVCLMRTGKLSEAEPHLRVAAARGIAEAPRYLAELSLDEYRVDDALTHLESYRKALKKARKEMTVEGEELEKRAERISAALERVEKVVVIDSIAVDREEFFKAYRLTPESGSLNSSEILPEGMEAANPTVVYMPENRSYMAWAIADKKGTPQLVQSQQLADGSWDVPVPMGENLGEGGDANYPFIMSDGVTLYYANDGENSIGGLDIFISRRDDEGFLQPQNIGMPYNSPYDDYMLAIDEVTGVGWWATDRNRLGDKVTIYKFIPSDLRVNYPTDEPRLLSFARLDNIRATWANKNGYADLLEKIEKIDTSRRQAKDAFRFALPGGRIVTQMDQLPNARSKAAMEQYLHAQSALVALQKKLSGLRSKVRNGKVDKNTVIQMEKQVEVSRKELKRLANEVVKAAR